MQARHNLTHLEYHLVMRNHVEPAHRVMTEFALAQKSRSTKALVQILKNADQKLFGTHQDRDRVIDSICTAFSQSERMKSNPFVARKAYLSGIDLFKMYAQIINSVLKTYRTQNEHITQAPPQPNQAMIRLLSLMTFIQPQSDLSTHLKALSEWWVLIQKRLDAGHVPLEDQKVIEAWTKLMALGRYTKPPEKAAAPLFRRKKHEAGRPLSSTTIADILYSTSPQDPALQKTEYSIQAFMRSCFLTLQLAEVDTFHAPRYASSLQSNAFFKHHPLLKAPELDYRNNWAWILEKLIERIHISGVNSPKHHASPAVSANPTPNPASTPISFADRVSLYQFLENEVKAVQTQITQTFPDEYLTIAHARNWYLYQHLLKSMLTVYVNEERLSNTASGRTLDSSLISASTIDTSTIGSSLLSTTLPSEFHIQAEDKPTLMASHDIEALVSASGLAVSMNHGGDPNPSDQEAHCTSVEEILRFFQEIAHLPADVETCEVTFKLELAASFPTDTHGRPFIRTRQIRHSTFSGCNSILDDADSSRGLSEADLESEGFGAHFQRDTSNRCPPEFRPDELKSLFQGSILHTESEITPLPDPEVTLPGAIDSELRAIHPCETTEEGFFSPDDPRVGHNTHDQTAPKHMMTAHGSTTQAHGSTTQAHGYTTQAPASTIQAPVSSEAARTADPSLISVARNSTPERSIFSCLTCFRITPVVNLFSRRHRRVGILVSPQPTLRHQWTSTPSETQHPEGASYAE